MMATESFSGVWNFTILFSKQKYYTHGILFHKTFIFQFDKNYRVQMKFHDKI